MCYMRLGDLYIVFSGILLLLNNYGENIKEWLKLDYSLFNSLIKVSLTVTVIILK